MCVGLFKQWGFPLKYLKLTFYIIFTTKLAKAKSHSVDQRKAQPYSLVEAVGVEIVATFLEGNLAICIKLQR